VEVDTGAGFFIDDDATENTDDLDISDLIADGKRVLVIGFRLHTRNDVFQQSLYKSNAFTLQIHGFTLAFILYYNA